MASTVAVETGKKQAWYSGIDRRLWIILGVAYAGWLLDAMDLNFITVVLGPCLKDLLGRGCNSCQHRALRRHNRRGTIGGLGVWRPDAGDYGRLHRPGPRPGDFDLGVFGIHRGMRAGSDLVGVGPVPVLRSLGCR